MFDGHNKHAQLSRINIITSKGGKLLHGGSKTTAILFRLRLRFHHFIVLLLSKAHSFGITILKPHFQFHPFQH